jgi:hypothetical protein
MASVTLLRDFWFVCSLQAQASDVLSLQLRARSAQPRDSMGNCVTLASRPRSYVLGPLGPLFLSPFCLHFLLGGPGQSLSFCEPQCPMEGEDAMLPPGRLPGTQRGKHF